MALSQIALDVEAFRNNITIIFVILLDLTDINECATNNGKDPCLGNASVCIKHSGLQLLHVSLAVRR